MKAFIFDLNGTIVNDMPYHIRALYEVLKSLGSGISPEEARLECYGKFEEIIERIFPARFSLEERISIRREKEIIYRREFKPQLKLIEGLDQLLVRAREAQIPMAIGSAAIKENIDFVIDGLQIRDYFDVIVSADEVEFSKPHPETFIKCAAQLGHFSKDCIVFEDSTKGVEAAARAGMRAVAITTMHTAAEFQYFKNLLAARKDFNNICEDIFANLL